MDLASSSLTSSTTLYTSFTKILPVNVLIFAIFDTLLGYISFNHLTISSLPSPRFKSASGIKSVCSHSSPLIIFDFARDFEIKRLKNSQYLIGSQPVIFNNQNTILDA